jgi:hypothetical protein
VHNHNLSIDHLAGVFFFATYAYSQLLKVGPPFSIQGIGQSFPCVNINEDKPMNQSVTLSLLIVTTFSSYMCESWM